MLLFIYHIYFFTHFLLMFSFCGMNSYMSYYIVHFATFKTLRSLHQFPRVQGTLKELFYIQGQNEIKSQSFNCSPFVQ